MTEKKKMQKMEAIKAFFAQDGGRPVTVGELKALTSDDRTELANLAAKALDVELITPKP